MGRQAVDRSGHAVAMLEAGKDFTEHQNTWNLFFLGMSQNHHFAQEGFTILLG